MKNSTVILIMVMCTLGPSLVIGFVGQASVKALGRNPSASKMIFISMILAFFFAGVIAIVALLVIFLLYGE